MRAPAQAHRRGRIALNDSLVKFIVRRCNLWCDRFDLLHRGVSGCFRLSLVALVWCRLFVLIEGVARSLMPDEFALVSRPVDANARLGYPLRTRRRFEISLRARNKYG